MRVRVRGVRVRKIADSDRENHEKRSMIEIRMMNTAVRYAFESTSLLVVLFSLSVIGAKDGLTHFPR